MTIFIYISRMTTVSRMNSSTCQTSFSIRTLAYFPKEGSEDFTYMLLLNPKLSSGKVLRAYVTDEEEFTVDVLPRENANGSLLRRAVDQGRKLEYSLKGKS